MTAQGNQTIWATFQKSLFEGIARIDEKYYTVKRQNADCVYRERVYCYELYHELRLQLGDQFPYILHGELDKAGHHDICQFFGESARPVPDFLLHTPGGGENIAVMEVKVSGRSSDLLLADIAKIGTFVEKAKYEHGLFLLFGDAEPAVKKSDQFPQIHILWHNEVGSHPVILTQESRW